MITQHETKLLSRAAQGPPRPNPNLVVSNSLVHAEAPQFALVDGGMDPLFMESMYAFMQSKKGSAGKGGSRDTSTLTCYYCD
jgi:hypothetical protein